LVALAGEESEFFSGLNVNAAAVSGGDGQAVQVEKEIGVKLSVTPEFLEDGRIKLAIVAERIFLATPNTTSIDFTYRIDTSKTNVKANVAMNFGETLILSGMSEKETERTRDGVPLLQDLPLVQYLFSKRTTRDFQKSVLILVTPRPTNYIYRSEANKKKAGKSLSKSERVLSELQARYSDWFRPYPNWASVFHHMQANSLYREFRTGDVALEKWESQQSLGERLRQALEFIYY
jgi:type II secretory pathway component GspD/PulD (secretin)